MKSSAAIESTSKRKHLTAWQQTMVRFRKNTGARFALWVIKLLVLIGLFADFIANDKPLYAEYHGKTYFPAAKDILHNLGISKWDPELIHADWKAMELTSALWAPVRWSPDRQDMQNFRRISPFGKQKIDNWKSWHFLGTDDRGRDLLAGLIHGTRISLLIGILAMGVASLIGVILGAIAGYYGDDRMQISRIGVLFLILFLPVAWFYGFQIRQEVLQASLKAGSITLMLNLGLNLIIFGSILAFSQLLALPFRRIPWLGKKVYVLADMLISRSIETISVFPALLVLLVVQGITGTMSIYMVMVILGLIGWTGIARFTRGEFLRNRDMEYVQAARSLGYRDTRIIFRHILPNSLTPVLVVIVFGIGGAILAESSLSFLLPGDRVSWGSLLAESRRDIGAWWLAVFPGFAIFATVTLFNLLGEGLREAIDPNTRS